MKNRKLVEGIVGVENGYLDKEEKDDRQEERKN